MRKHHTKYNRYAITPRHAAGVTAMLHRQGQLTSAPTKPLPPFPLEQPIPDQQPIPAARALRISKLTLITLLKGIKRHYPTAHRLLDALHLDF